MVYLDSKFCEHVIDCLEKQKIIHMQPLKIKIEWQDRIDKTIEQFKGIVQDVVEEEKRQARRKSMFMIPDISMFDDETKSLEDLTEDETV